jgi:hypothetical protein
MGCVADIGCSPLHQSNFALICSVYVALFSRHLLTGASAVNRRYLHIFLSLNLLSPGNLLSAGWQKDPNNSGKAIDYKQITFVLKILVPPRNYDQNWAPHWPTSKAGYVLPLPLRWALIS